MAVFAGSTSNGAITNGGLTYAYTAGGDCANCLTDAPIAGRQYVELRIVRQGAGLAAASLYGGSNYALIDWGSLGQWWGEPGCTIGTDSPWSLYLSANYGSDAQVYDGGFSYLDGAEPVDEVIALAIDASTREVWAWRIGDPQPAVPTFVLEGADPIFVGASSSDPASTVHLLPVADQRGPTPAGFTDYMGGGDPEPPSGDTSGAGTLALTAAGTGRARHRAAGGATLALQAQGQPRTRRALRGSASITSTSAGTATARARAVASGLIALQGTGAPGARASTRGSGTLAFTTQGRPDQPGMEGQAELGFTTEGRVHGRARASGAASLQLQADAAGKAPARASGVAQLAFIAEATTTPGRTRGAATLALQASGIGMGQARATGAASLATHAEGTPSVTIRTTGAARLGFACLARPGSRYWLAGQATLQLESDALPRARGVAQGAAALALQAQGRGNAATTVTGAARLTLTARMYVPGSGPPPVQASRPGAERVSAPRRPTEQPSTSRETSMINVASRNNEPLPAAVRPASGPQTAQRPISSRGQS